MSRKGVTIDELAGIVQNGFVAVDARFNAMGARLDSIEFRLDAIEARLDTIEVKLASLEKKMDAHDLMFEQASRELAELRALASHGDRDVMKLEGRVDKLEKYLGII